MSYPKNAASPKRVYVGELVAVADGSLLASTSGVAVNVTLDSGASGGGAGTLAYDNGFRYTPTQGETNGDVLSIAISKTGYISAGVNVVTDPVALKVDVDTIKTQTVATTGAGTITFPGAGTLPKLGDKMDFVDAPNGTAVTAINLATSAALVKLLAACYDTCTVSGNVITLSNGHTQTVTGTGRVLA